LDSKEEYIVKVKWINENEMFYTVTDDYINQSEQMLYLTVIENRKVKIPLRNVMYIEVNN
jgi:hypothetical protein